MTGDRQLPLILAACGAVWLIVVLYSAMTAKDETAFVQTSTPAEIQAFAREQLDDLQQRSFAERIEYCGMIFEQADGSLGSTNVIAGHEAECDITYFDMPGMLPVASYHTHGEFNKNYDSEVPSLIDLNSEIESGMLGFVATPGGRLWRVDPNDRAVVQVCGAGCLRQDPRYQPCPRFDPEQRYSLSELQKRAMTDTSQC